jgi:hypothetical protein
MTFYEVLEQVVTLLQRHGRMSYRALTRQFQLDEAYLEDLKAELVDIQRVAVDQDGTISPRALTPPTSRRPGRGSTRWPEAGCSLGGARGARAGAERMGAGRQAEARACRCWGSRATLSAHRYGTRGVRRPPLCHLRTAPDARL